MSQAGRPYPSALYLSGRGLHAMAEPLVGTGRGLIGTSAFVPMAVGRDHGLG